MMRSDHRRAIIAELSEHAARFDRRCRALCSGGQLARMNRNGRATAYAACALHLWGRIEELEAELAEEMRSRNMGPVDA